MDLAPPRRPGQGTATAEWPPPPRRPHQWRQPAVCAGLFAGFALFAVVVELGGLSPVDDWVMTWTAHHRERFLADAADVVVTLATPQLLILVTLVVAVWRAWRRRCRREFVRAAIRLALLVVCVLSLKDVLARPGPPLHAPFRITPLDHLLHLAQTAAAGAFPSGHTTATLVCFAVLLGISWPPSGSRRNVLVAGGAVISAALVYMDYHWLTDVVGAWLLAAAILSVPVPEDVRTSGRPSHRPRRAPGPPAPLRRRSASTRPMAAGRPAPR